MTDTQVIHGCNQGFRTSQKELYSRYAKKMFAVCYRYAPDSATAEDMLQEGFIRVFNNLHTYRNEGSFEGWIRKIVINTALEMLRKKQAYILPDDFENTNDTGVAETILEVLEAKDIMKLIQQIPYGYREVLNLFIVDGFSHKEIAETMCISENNSKLRLLRARNMLKKLIVQSTK